MLDGWYSTTHGLVSNAYDLTSTYDVDGDTVTDDLTGDSVWHKWSFVDAGSGYFESYYDHVMTVDLLNGYLEGGVLAVGVITGTGTASNRIEFFQLNAGQMPD